MGLRSRNSHFVAIFDSIKIKNLWLAVAFAEKNTFSLFYIKKPLSKLVEKSPRLVKKKNFSGKGQNLTRYQNHRPN